MSKDVEIDFSKPLIDPSGSGLTVKPVAVEPNYIEVKRGNKATIKFTVKDGTLPAGTSCRILYFRYQNPDPQYHGAWWKPVHSTDPGNQWNVGQEFEDVTPAGQRGDELWIEDKATNDILYPYVLQIELTDSTGTHEYVLDPEIHNKE
jgi:hypothetical protein